MLRILALAPGGRFFALATASGDTLLRIEVRSLRHVRDDGAKFAAFLDALRTAFDEDRPDMLVVEAIGRLRETAIVRAQVLRAMDEARSRGVEVRTVTAAESANRVTGYTRLADAGPVLADRHPEVRAFAGGTVADRRRADRVVAAVVLALGAQPSLLPSS